MSCKDTTNGVSNNLEQSVPVRVSAIMPVFNGADFIRQSLPPLVAMRTRGELREVLVVDDGSTDDSADIARELGARVLSSGGRKGPGGARNIAAEEACGDVLWFVDADVVVYDNSAKILASGFTDPNVVAVFGSYDDQPTAKNFLSQYKNLVHHFYHQKAKEEASTFWSGCGAVRKAEFLALGGFDIEMFKYPSIEDIELGYRLLEADGRIKLITNLQCTHLKEWRLMNLIHTEVFRRAIPWSRLMLNRSGMVDDLNVSVSERLRAVCTAVSIIALLGALLTMLPWTVFFLSVVAVFYANKEITTLFFKRKGAIFAFSGLMFHQFYYLYSTLAFAWVLVERLLGRKGV